MMRILHVNDVAGVAGTLAKYQTRLGHKVSVVSRSGYDNYLLQHFYNVQLIGIKNRKGIVWRTLSVLWFYCFISWSSLRFDVVHIHGQYLVWFFIPFKAKVLEFHGSDVRHYPNRNWAIGDAVTKVFLKLYFGGIIR